ncbi:ribonuclease H-like domain-containing protein [Mycena rebaudengoi]|nr:ribonuclease H-like domain-containing protein [Mycena rebaudengoi]
MVPWLGIICYLVHNARYKRFVLDFIRIRGSDTGSALAQALYNCLVRYGIHLRLLALAADNASNNNTLVDALALKIGASGRFRGKLHRIRCFAHILNLVMKAFLRVFLRTKKSARAQGTAEEWETLEREVTRYDADDSDSIADDSDEEMNNEEEEEEERGEETEEEVPIDAEIDATRNAADEALIDECEDRAKCTGSQIDDDIELPPLKVEERRQAIGLSKTVQNSSLNSEAWEAKSNKLRLTLLELVKVIETRWNLHAHCILRIIERQEVVIKMCTDRGLKLRQYTFSGEEWTFLEQLEEVLEKTFIAATEKISQAEVAFVFEVIPLIDKFTTLFGQMIDDETLHISIRHAANTALTVLNKYYLYTDDSEIYRIAMSVWFSYLGNNTRVDTNTYYFLTVRWPQIWIDKALRLLRRVWTEDYKPKQNQPNSADPATTDSFSRAQSGSRRKISFDVQINYGQTDSLAPDALDTWLAAPALPYETDPIGHHARQRAAAKTAQNVENEAFAQMCLDYLSAPATGTVSKLRNQLSEDSAHAAVMVGQWGGDPDLIAVEEFEKQLTDGWTRKKKRKADVPAEGEPARKVIEIIDDDINSSSVE